MNADPTDALRVMLADDEPLARSRLAALLDECHDPACVVVARAADGVQALEMLRNVPLDLVLLDIRMPGLDGLRVAQALRGLAAPPAVVFVTAHTDHALQAFELEAVDYLTKPVRLERLRQALHKVQRLRAVPPPVPADDGEVLLIQDRSRTERVPLASIVFFKAELKYITVRTPARSYILDGALNELEERFRERFIRIHRNALVSRRAARALERCDDPEEGEGWALRLDGVDERLLVSRRQLAAVRDMLAGH